MTRAESWKAYVALIGTVIVWGAAPAFVRSISLAAGPADSMFIRLVSVALMCLPLLPFCGVYIARKDWPRLLLISWVGIFGYFVGSIYGFAYVSAGIGGIIFATQSFVIVAMAAAIGTDRITAATLLGLAVSFAGILFLFGGNSVGDNGTNPVLGGILIFACGIAFSVNVVFAKPLIEKYGPLRITVHSMLLTGVPALAFYSPGVVANIKAFRMFEWATLFYLGFIGTIVAVITWNYAVARLRPNTLAASLYAVPVLSAIAGVFVLGESISGKTVVAGAIILIGVAISEYGKNITLPKRFLGLAAVIFAVTMWGLVPVAMRFLLLDMKPQTAIILRLYPAAVAALAIAAWIGWRDLSRSDWIRILAASFIGEMGYHLLAGWGIKLIPAAWTGMLFGLEPVFIALAAWLFSGERLSRWFVIGLGVALLGTSVLVIGSGSGSVKDVSLFGVILVTISTMGWAIYTTLIRPVSNRHGPVAIACLSIAITGFPTLFLADKEVAAEIFNLNSTQLFATAYLSIVATVLAIAAWNFSLSRMDSSKAGMFLFVQPVVAAVGGVLLLGETLSVWLLSGGAMILLGVVISQYKGNPATLETHDKPPQAGVLTAP